MAPRVWKIFSLAIAGAINEAMEIIANLKGDHNTYRFGAVVYRDRREGPYMTEVQRLTSDSRKVSAFLNRVPVDTEIKNAHDRDYPEALYLGIHTALRGVGMVKKHTNVIVVVGDAGNHYREEANDPTAISQNDLINMLEDYSCHMLVFQAQNPGNDDTYEDFVEQMKFVVRKVGENNYRRIKDIGASMKVKLNFPQWIADGRRKNVFRLEGGAMSGALLASEKGGEIPLYDLKKEISRLILGHQRASK